MLTEMGVNPVKYRTHILNTLKPSALTNQTKDVELFNTL